MNPFNDRAAERSNRRVINARRRQVAEEAVREQQAEAERAARLAKLPALPVIFRAETGSRHFHADIVAVFPTLPGTRDPSTVTVYAHNGQHSTGTRGWYNFTRPATPEEYADLLRELRGIYERDDDADAVRLVIVKRWTKHHDVARRAELERTRG